MELEVITRLNRDIKAAAATLTATEARYLVDTFYQMQANRIRAANQIRAMSTVSDPHEPHETLTWLNDNAGVLERNIKSTLDVYGNAHRVGVWSKAIRGIGPIISAGLIAHIDITRAPTVGHIWRFAGLDPTVRCEKGQKRPWNASLKTLCWKLGESFVKVSGHKDDVYGKLYLQRKTCELAHNDAGEYAAQAADKLERFKIGKSTDAYASYSTGRLPPGHLHARAKRWAVKLFLAHWHEGAYFAYYGRLPPKPYAIAHLDHAHVIAPPYVAMIPGWAEARAAVGASGAAEAE